MSKKDFNYPLEAIQKFNNNRKSDQYYYKKFNNTDRAYSYYINGFAFLFGRLWLLYKGLFLFFLLTIIPESVLIYVSYSSGFSDILYFFIYHLILRFIIGYTGDIFYRHKLRKFILGCKVFKPLSFKLSVPLIVIFLAAMKLFITFIGYSAYYNNQKSNGFTICKNEGFLNKKFDFEKIQYLNFIEDSSLLTDEMLKGFEWMSNPEFYNFVHYDNQLLAFYKAVYRSPLIKRQNLKTGEVFYKIFYLPYTNGFQTPFLIEELGVIKKNKSYIYVVKMLKYPSDDKTYIFLDDKLNALYQPAITFNLVNVFIKDQISWEKLLLLY